MINFVFMLTHHDSTVPDAVDHIDQLAATGLRYLGFKDVGATPERQKEINEAAHAAGFTTMLEVVSVSREAEVASVEAAIAAGVDWVLGGTNPEAVVPLLRGTAIRYCPFRRVGRRPPLAAPARGLPGRVDLRRLLRRGPRH
ncbi:MAG: hypothetical protein QOG76_4839, partial [Pseudonocardiales bacterium]|nr:hypothetical protein [Pseudonocardiales bacterium]